jgi:hypothetical protein
MSSGRLSTGCETGSAEVACSRDDGSAGSSRVQGDDDRKCPRRRIPARPGGVATTPEEGVTTRKVHGHGGAAMTISHRIIEVGEHAGRGDYTDPVDAGPWCFSCVTMAYEALKAAQG